MNIAIISGSARPERKSHQVAEEVQRRLNTKENVTTWLLDVKELQFPILDYVYEKHPNPPAKMKETSEKLFATDAFIIVSPEHNGSYSGAVKNTLDYFFKEYEKKAFGIVTVSAGGFGGISAGKNLQQYILTLQGIVMPKMQLTPKVQNIFEDGKLIDENYSKTLDTFLNEFMWLANAIAQARKTDAS